MRLKAPVFATRLEILKEGRWKRLIPASITYLLKERNAALCCDQLGFLWSLWKGHRWTRQLLKVKAWTVVTKSPWIF